VSLYFGHVLIKAFRKPSPTLDVFFDQPISGSYLFNTVLHTFLQNCPDAVSSYSQGIEPGPEPFSQLFAMVYLRSPFPLVVFQY
jgi:hypothetical protein